MAKILKMLMMTTLRVSVHLWMYLQIINIKKQSKVKKLIKYREMTEDDNEVVAFLVKYNLKKVGLDLPGTVYFDEGLDHLSEYYGDKERRYYVIEDESGNVIGGIGFAEFSPMEYTAELQKLYLMDSAKGSGLGYEMISFIEEKMREAGYKFSYLETHDNLQAAIHIYKKMGYEEINRPKEVVHSTMNRFFKKELIPKGIIKKCI
jgi:putative acetyltransferase